MMDRNFWHQKWERNEIGFHEPAVNSLLVTYCNRLSLEKGDRLFLPLCGKTLDIPWLLGNGFRVAGAELSRLAVEQLFAELGVAPDRARLGAVDHYSAPGLDIFVGDIFDLSGAMLGQVDAVYDRAALVALPADMRPRYTAHLSEITGKAPQLLICYEYDQNLLEGPPFSISGEEVLQHYGHRYQVELLEARNVPGGLRGTAAVRETVWLLKNALGISS